MVRTRRQAAHQPEPATNAEPPESDSDSAVSDIPASGRRSRADPASLGTLRPPREGRPKLFLDSKKRRAAAPRQVASQSPPETKKRRAESTTKLSESKRKKTLPADAVNPVAMAVFNQFNKRTRGKKGGAPVPQPRGITVEIPQSRERHASALPEGQMVSDAEEQNESDDEPVEEEWEQHLGAKPSQTQEQRIRGIRSDAQPKVGRSRDQVLQWAPTDEDQHDSGKLPPRSGQGSQREASSQKTARESKFRVPQLAFSERSAAHETRRGGSESNRADFTSSKQPKDRPTVAHPVSEMEPLQEMFRNDQSSPKRLAVDHSIFVEDDDPVEDEEADALVESLSDEHVRESVTEQEFSAAEVQWTVQVPSKEIKSMCHLMGAKGWTGCGKSWDSQLSDPQALQDDKRLPTTLFGKRVCTFVAFLRRDYKRAPQVLAKQTMFLRENEENTGKALADITHQVNKTYERYYAAIENSEEGNQVTLKHVLKEDIIQCVIPVLVLLLRDFFLLGGGSDDEHGNRRLPEKSGTFTAKTLHLLRRTAGRIRQLAEMIKRDTESSRLAPSSDDEDGIEDEGKNKLTTHEQPDTLRKMLEKRAKQRISLHDSICQFSNTLSEARERLARGVNKEARRKEMLERAEEEKAERERTALLQSQEREKRAAEEQAEREREERLARAKRLERQKRAEQEMARREREREEERVRRQRRYEAMCASTQRLRDDTEPASSMPKDARRREGNVTGRRTVAHKRDMAGEGRTRSPELGGFFDDVWGGHPEPQRERDRLSPWLLDDDYGADEQPVPKRRLWRDAERTWLVRKLREGGKPDYESWAEALERRVDDVRREAAAIKFSIRDLAAKEGKTAYAWARR